MEWRKGPETLRAGARVSLRQEGAVCELEIRDLTVEDAGEYSCMCGQEKTSATLAVRGKDHVWPSRAVFAVQLLTQASCTHPTFPPRLSITVSPRTVLCCA